MFSWMQFQCCVSYLMLLIKFVMHLKYQYVQSSAKRHVQMKWFMQWELNLTLPCHLFFQEWISFTAWASITHHQPCKEPGKHIAHSLNVDMDCRKPIMFFKQIPLVLWLSHSCSFLLKSKKTHEITLQGLCRNVVTQICKAPLKREEIGQQTRGLSETLLSKASPHQHSSKF